MTKITLTQVKEKAVDLAHSGLAKSTQVAEMTKLQLNIASQEDIIKKAFFEMGKRYYEINSEHPEPAYEATCQKVAASFEQITRNKERIKQLRNPDIISIYDMPDNVVDLEVDDLFDMDDEQPSETTSEEPMEE